MALDEPQPGIGNLKTEGDLARFVEQLVSPLRTRFEQLRGVIHEGNGSPEGVVTAPVGHLYLRRDGGASTTLYVKQSGSANTGWVAK